MTGKGAASMASRQNCNGPLAAIWSWMLRRQALGQGGEVHTGREGLVAGAAQDGAAHAAFLGEIGQGLGQGHQQGRGEGVAALGPVQGEYGQPAFSFDQEFRFLVHGILLR